MIVFQKRLGSLVNKTKLLEEIGMLKDGDYEIILFKRDRSTMQNRYLRWGVYWTIAEYTGYDQEYIHEVMKHKFLLDSSGKIPVPRSTASLNTKEFTDYVDAIRNFMAEFVYIPSAEEWKKANGLA